MVVGKNELKSCAFEIFDFFENSFSIFRVLPCFECLNTCFLLFELNGADQLSKLSLVKSDCLVRLILSSFT